MTFSVSRDGGAFEWGGASLSAVFCQSRQLLNPDHWRTLYDIVRFNVCSRRLLGRRKFGLYVSGDVSIGEYLQHEGYSESFRDNYLVVCASSRALSDQIWYTHIMYAQPMTAAIWSTPPNKCALDFSAYTLVGLSS